MCAAFCDPAASHSARFAALAAATAVHKRTTVDCMMGKGVDRHLFALHKLALGAAAEVPAIFSDAAYARFKDIRLSTSTLASPALAGGGFGPVSETSYGVGYGIEERGAHFHIMNYTGEGTGTDGGVFVAAVEQALRDFRETISAAKPAAPRSK